MKDERTGLVPETLTEQEDHFCTLFVEGDPLVRGKAKRCFEEAFGKDQYLPGESQRILKRKEIQKRIKELSSYMNTDAQAIAIKIEVTETLRRVMEETSTVSFQDKWGIDLSPAPLRAVAVNAAKALMELYPIKHVQENKLKIESNNSNVTFNVIVPTQTNNQDTE